MQEQILSILWSIWMILPFFQEASRQLFAETDRYSASEVDNIWTNRECLRELLEYIFSTYFSANDRISADVACRNLLCIFGLPSLREVTSTAERAAIERYVGNTDKSHKYKVIGVYEIVRDAVPPIQFGTDESLPFEKDDPILENPRDIFDSCHCGDWCVPPNLQTLHTPLPLEKEEEYKSFFSSSSSPLCPLHTPLLSSPFLSYRDALLGPGDEVAVPTKRKRSERETHGRKKRRGEAGTAEAVETDERERAVAGREEEEVRRGDYASRLLKK